MRTLSMFIIGLVLVSCNSIKNINIKTKNNDPFIDVINTYRNSNGCKPLKFDLSLDDVSLETINEYISYISPYHYSDTNNTINTYRRISLPNNHGEINFLEYLNGVKFDTLGINVFKDETLKHFMMKYFPSFTNKITTNIKIKGKRSGNSYSVSKDVADGIYDYNGTTINVVTIGDEKVTWYSGSRPIANKTIPCFKLNTLDSKSKELIKSIYILNNMVKNTLYKKRILNPYVKDISYKTCHYNSFTISVVNVQ